jgi:ABC-2 type transport system permease protein
MTAFTNHFLFEFKTGLRNSNQLLMHYLFPLGFYAMMGLVMVKINPGFGDVLIPAMVIFTAMSSALLGFPGTLVEAREAGIFRSFKINGVPALSILSIPVLTTIFHTLIASAIIAFTATPLFGGLSPVDWGSFTLITLITIFTFGGIGALIGVISKDSRSMVLFSQLIFLPSMLIGGLMVPLDFLPPSVRAFSGLFPSTYAMQAYVGFAYKRATLLDPAISLLLLLASGLLAFALAIFLFRWDSQNSARSGHPLLALLAFVPYVLGVILMG